MSDRIHFTGTNLADCLVFTGVSRESAEGCQVMRLPLFVETATEQQRVSPGQTIVRDGEDADGLPLFRVE